MTSKYHPIAPFEKIGPLYDSKQFKDAKDPCIVFDGKIWHIYGSGGSVRNEEWVISHATSPSLEGPWKEEIPAILQGVTGVHVAAPGVVFDASNNLFHMSVQKDFTAVGGGIEYLVSGDGHTFVKMNTLLEPIPDSDEAGLYDPHFSVVNGKKYMVYSGMPAKMINDRPFTPQPEIYLAESTTNLWTGPWRRVKKILSHKDIEWHHNRRDHADYEWGIEGPQLVGLPDGSVLLNATCFLENGERGTRQRVFFARAETPEGPYISMGPVLLERENEWESGENGHATVQIIGDILYLFYQGRSKSETNPIDNNWRYGIAKYNVKDIMAWKPLPTEPELVSTIEKTQ